jgi:hypothetical protein
MKTRSTIILVAAAVALSFAFTAIVTPKAVKAAIATLIRDQDNAARHPFTTSCFTTSPPTGSTLLNCSTPAIPAGEEVVIETVSVSVAAGGGNRVASTQLSVTEGGTSTEIDLNPAFDTGVFQPAQSRMPSSQLLRFYADPGSVIGCVASLNGPLSASELLCTFHGYSVSLP